MNKAFRFLHTNAVLAVVIWIVLIVISTYWDLAAEKQHISILAKNTAQDHFDKDLAFRLWATSHGGVYVPIDDKTPPNPYLSHISERDISTPSGKRLTLMNPAYMIRQFSEYCEKLHGIREQITSLKPLNPINAPDEWEKNALKAFEKGNDVVSEFTDINGKPFLRMMRPMITKEGCLKCHAHQGYKAGDIRGGISVAVPMQPLLALSKQIRRKIVLPHILFGFIGLLVIGFIVVRGRQRITEQLKAENKLTASRKQYQTLAQVSPVGIFQTDSYGDCLYVNEQWEKLTGLSNQEALGENWAKALHPEDRQEINEAWYKSVKETTPFALEYRFMKPDGVSTWVFGQAQADCDSEGKIVGYVGSITDITVRKEAEEALQQRTDELKKRVNELNCLYKVADLIETRNIGFDEILQGIVDLIPAAFQFPEITGVRLIFEDREFTTDNFRESPWSLSKSVNANADDKEVGSLEINYSKEKPAADNGPFLKEEVTLLGAIIEHLNRIIERLRTEEEKGKLQKQLRQTQKMESIGTLAGGIAHDFNNILTAVLGFSGMVLDNLAEGSQDRDNQLQVINAGRRAKELVKQILTFSRQTEHENQLVQLHLIVKEAVKLLRSSIPSTIEIRQDIDPKSGFVMADPTQLHQIIMNLGTNAFQAMNDTGGIIGIQLRHTEVGPDKISTIMDLQPGHYIQLEVSDTGCGMDQETTNKIFEPYFTTKEKGKGTGLGLSVVHGIIKSYNGSITVYSEPGEGTTFHVYLPRHETAGSIKEAMHEKTKGIPTGTERILLVDDENAIAQMEQLMLESLGYRVTALTNSTEALKMFTEKPDNFDLVITDMTMPNMTGAELAKELQKIKPKIPIILCTGFSQLINGEKAKLLGIKEYIMKPLIKEELAQIVRKVLDKGSGTAT